MSRFQLHEVILYVQDMQGQLRFYRDIIGLEVTFPSVVTLMSEIHWVTFQTGACTLALHYGGKGSLGNDAPRFVFKVDDIQKTRLEMIERKVVVGEIRSPAPGTQVFDAVDPEGNRFSFESVFESAEESSPR